MRKILLGFTMLFLFVTAYSQTITVTGKVTDDKNAAIAGASIVEKGTKNGTVGVYSLNCVIE